MPLQKSSAASMTDLSTFRNSKRGNVEFLYAWVMESLARLPFVETRASLAHNLISTQDRLMGGISLGWLNAVANSRIRLWTFLGKSTGTNRWFHSNFAQRQRELKLAQEYRTRLIADVVTGKLDVRDAAEHLPEVDPIAGGNQVGTIQAESNTHLRSNT